MSQEPQYSPLEKLVESAKVNLPGKTLAGISQDMVKDYPVPGSLASFSQLSGQPMCSQCQAVNVPQANFCRNCGSSLTKHQTCPSSQTPDNKGDKS